MEKGHQGVNIMTRQTTNKKSNSTKNCSSDPLFLAKCLVEQHLEQVCRGRIQVSYRREIDSKNNNNGKPAPPSVYFRAVRTKMIAAVATDTNLYVFAKPIKKFRNLPLDIQTIKLDSIVKSDGVCCCVKCKRWVTRATTNVCPCGGFLKKRKRFHAQDTVTEPMDELHIEIQMVLKDIRISNAMSNKPRRKVAGNWYDSIEASPRRPTVTPYTPPVDQTPKPTTGFLTAVTVKGAHGTALNNDEKYAFFETLGVDITEVQTAESKEFAAFDAQRQAKIATDSWNEVLHIAPDFVEDEHTQQLSKRQRGHKNTRYSTQPYTTEQDTSTTTYQNRNKQRNPSHGRIAVTCHICHSNTPSLVENTCPDCFLKVQTNKQTQN